MTDVMMELTEIKNSIEELTTPRINSKKKAAKYLVMSVKNLEYLLHIRAIKFHVDEFGKQFFLKDELHNYLRTR